MQIIRCLCLLLLCTFVISCSESEPLKIGFLGNMTGRGTGLSLAARDGVQLAVEAINEQGGLNGRRIELITFDNQNNETKAREGVNSLADSGVVAIIGPLTSQMSVAATPTANKRKIALISPTTSTLELSGLDDHFFRVYPTCESNASTLADYAVKQAKNRRLAIISDLSNASFTTPWGHYFKNRVLEIGGEIITTASFNSFNKDFSLLEMAKAIVAKQPDGILILTGSMEAALFSQQISKLSDNIDLYGSDWAFSGDLVQYGGKSVEGFTFTTNIDMESDVPTFLKFKNDFIERFDTPPKFPTVLAYESALLVFNALERNPDPLSLPETLKQSAIISGLQDSFQLDTYGDIKRPSYINQVQKGRFASLHGK